ncbi:MAG: hypothetical protein H6720_24635 [Sandaracinus sp.]|nr:hypothetical protein [Sandaracinus sp.]
MKSSLGLSVLVVALALGNAAHAQVPLLDGFGGTADYGTSCLGRNDDGSSRTIDLSSIFPSGLQFFDRTHTQMFVNTNGNITFSGAVPTYTPSAFPVANQPMIAPFWADVDIRGTACAEPDGGTGYAGDCQNPAENGVWWHLDPATRRVIVTWDRVGYYDCKVNRRMAFQLVLTAVGDGSSSCGGAGDFDVEFRFNRCEWNTGDASGGTDGLAPASAPQRCIAGLCPSNPLLPCRMNMCDPAGSATPAQAGFDAGNTRDYVEIMGSRTNSIHTTLCTMSNVGEPGIWRFQIRSGVIECPGAGDTCDTGMPGICAAGRTQCVADGVECRPEVGATDERCDALDNDCDGMVDDGDLCPAGQVCDRGVCTGVCFEGGCPAGEVCNAEGQCVDDGCESVTCAEGQRCVGGSCVGACDGVVCPPGQQCRGGRCVDLCAGAVCDDCTVCEDGACIPSCEYVDCPAGQTCQADGSCVENACATVTCPAGEYCMGGTCRDACSGVTCPMGETCMSGMCVPAPRPDAGMPMPGVDGGGVAPGVDGGGVMPGIDGGTAEVDAGRRVDGGGGDPGCGCRTTAPNDGFGGPFAGLTLLGLLAWRRRRRD